MAQESRESPEKIANQLIENKPRIVQLGEQLRDFNPRSVMIVGRGSSDHAGVFAKYFIEIELGIPTFAAAPSVSTIYNRQLILKDCLVIIISQSGRSPDILEEARQCKASGAYCVALLNDTIAPLADIVDTVIPLLAGEEKSVAATKSFLTTLSAIMQIVAYWKQDHQLISALDDIAPALKKVILEKQQLKADDLIGVKNLIVLGRGLGYAISKEMALKLKEVCAIHAEAFSSAEFLHGPVALVDEMLNVLMVKVVDESSTAHDEQALEIKNRGAKLIYLDQASQVLHPRIAPLIVMLRFYLDIEKVAVARELDPDNPIGLKKVTETL